MAPPFRDLANSDQVWNEVLFSTLTVLALLCGFVFWLKAEGYTHVGVRLRSEVLLRRFLNFQFLFGQVL